VPCIFIIIFIYAVKKEKTTDRFMHIHSIYLTSCFD